MDGFSIVAELRRDHRFAFTPLALTACAMVGAQERAMAAGFNSYVTKPIGISALRQRIVHFLESRPVSKAAGCAR